VDERSSISRGKAGAVLCMMVRSGYPFMPCTGPLVMGHHEWTITVDENCKFLLNLSLNNDTGIINNLITKFW